MAPRWLTCTECGKANVRALGLCTKHYKRRLRAAERGEIPEAECVLCGAGLETWHRNRKYCDRCRWPQFFDRMDRVWAAREVRMQFDAYRSVYEASFPEPLPTFASERRLWLLGHQEAPNYLGFVRVLLRELRDVEEAPRRELQRLIEEQQRDDAKTMVSRRESEYPSWLTDQWDSV